MDIYGQIAVRIIQGQEAIIGPVAIEQAQQIENMQVDWSKHEVLISGDEVAALEELVQKYKELFGHISVEVSKEAVGSLVTRVPVNGLPASLK